MVDVMVYIKNDTLAVSVWSKNSSFMLFGDEAANYIKNFYSSEPINIIEDKDDIDATIEYFDSRLTLKNYNDIFNNDKYSEAFVPIGVNVNKYMENMKSSKTKANISKKVTRKNKYNRNRIIATTLVLFLAASTAHVAFNKISGSKGEKPSTSSEVSMEDDSLNVNDSQDDEVLVNDNSITLEYNDRTSSKTAEGTKSKYSDVIKKYSSIYGLDDKLVLAIATQERGVHSEVTDQGGATGLMQIQNAVWDNASLKAYNFEYEEWETIVVDAKKLSDLDYNVKTGCMILQNYLNHMNYNIPAAVQSYNMGYNCVGSLISEYCKDEGKNFDDVLDDQTDIGWLKYRDSVPYGDSEYLEHVFSYCGNDQNITVVNPEGKAFSVKVTGSKKAEKSL